ncbi:MAG: hypothetical protein HYR84_12250 [Planctomycetes bacterium]|nr:hypothetical protein [Planctomycetota bacterium]
MATYTVCRLIALGFAIFGTDPGTIRFAPGLPVAVPRTGCALVAGTARADPGFGLRRARVIFFENGGVANDAGVALFPDGSYVAVLSGLKHGTTYEVRVEVVMSRENQVETLAVMSRFKQR